jgi:hypothetical protein
MTRQNATTPKGFVRVNGILVSLDDIKSGNVNLHAMTPGLVWNDKGVLRSTNA